MSLTSFLLSKSSEVVDTELDDLFKSAPKPTTSKAQKEKLQLDSQATANGKQKKLKRKTTSDADAEAEAGPSATSSKRLKSDAQPVSSFAKSSSQPSTESKSKSTSKSLGKESSSKITSKQKKKAPTPPSSDSDEEEEDEDENSDIENRYLAQRAKKEQVGKAGKEDEDEGEDEDEDVDSDSDSDSEDVDEGEEEDSVEDVEVGDDDEEDDEDEVEEAVSDDDDEGGEPPVHESLLKDKQSKNSSSGKSGKKKYVPEGETPEMRDRRTIFVGNLPIAVAQKRPLQKQLQRHILSFVPTAKIESTRFRSVPFQNPTSKLPGSDDEDSSATPSTKKPHHPHQHPSRTAGEKPTNHSTTRAQSWRSSKPGDEDETTIKKDEKSYLTPNQKKKIAFINHQFHSSADTVNCYVVFAHPIPSSLQAANVAPQGPTMDPYEAARVAVERGNNSVFMERVVRVDRVASKGKGAAKVGEGEGQGEGAQGDADPKFTVFVGNLDFASREEDVRVFFEKLVEKEKGIAPNKGGGAEEDGMDVDGEGKKGSWVVRVRIVRDRETQLGKGFAYVQFSDKECVDEILALEESKLKFAKRKLRVQRCKTIPGTSFKIKSTPSKSSSKTSSASSSKTQPTSSAKKPVRGPPTPITVPKGDPTLGDRLAHLPKAVRKDVKRNDGERVARRLAKKKARMAMGLPNAGSKDKKDVGREGRERKRAAGGQKGEGKNTGKKTGKRRVRSEKMGMKKNGKK